MVTVEIQTTECAMVTVALLPFSPVLKLEMSMQDPNPFRPALNQKMLQFHT